MTTPSARTVVLIHGLWMTPFAWEHWVERYEARGFTVLTPGYPGIGQGEAGLRALRDNPDAVAGVGVREIMDYLTDYVSKLDSAPVIMGHSFGGTFAQLLVGNGLGSAGVSIDGAATKGINVQPLSEVRSVLPVLDNPANINKASTLTPKQFHYAFPTPWMPTPPRPPTTATRRRHRPRSCSRAASPPSPRTRRRRSTTQTTTGPRCCSSPAAATTSFGFQSSKPT
jgi:pimeloyl-ACP methyl ester carboxylesterase